MLNYIELCAGGGGMRAGLDAAGWNCLLAVDHDQDAVAIHKLAHGDVRHADVTKLSINDIPKADAWVAGFPCQPFSTSGNRLGFEHGSGNVFEHIVKLLAEGRPRLIVLENVEGLLINKSGHTMTVILSKLTQLGYNVSWLLIDLRWFGIAQSRPRLFLIGSLLDQKKDVSNFPDSPSFCIFDGLLQSLGAIKRPHSSGNLAQAELKLRPQIGKAAPTGKSFFGACGSATGQNFESFDITTAVDHKISRSLGDIVAPNFRFKDSLRSGRYYARGGPTRLCLRTIPISHCIGTSLGGAPLFAVQLSLVKNAKDRKDFLEFSNWSREQDGLLVMRLRPNRAVLLFGPHTQKLKNALTSWQAGDTRKYKVVGNMVAPICAKNVAELINESDIRG
jgi:site-specific DNA-cytosine methylase